MENYQGYRPDFMGGELHVQLPTLAPDRQADGAPELLTYTHFSILLSRARRFPYFTATNINGGLAWQIPRKKVFDSGSDEWKEDTRYPGFQLGQYFYNMPKSDFQRGHMTKREDPQWGTTEEVARQAARETFTFANCVPQVQSLNTEAWGQLETYILRKKAIPTKALINIFTGPVLAATDPVFIYQVRSQWVQLPKLFWKVVYYTNDGIQLSRAAFMMGQQNALLASGIVHPRPLMLIEHEEVAKRQEDYFAEYKDVALYQVSVSFVEELSGLSFPAAQEAYRDERATEVILRAIEVPLTEKHELFGPTRTMRSPSYEFDNLQL